jgi:hypothetical protein
MKRPPRTCMGFLLLVIPAVLLLTAATSLAQCPDFLLGTWEWEYSVGGIAGWTLTPESVGYTIQLEFLDSGTMLYYEDQVLQQVYSYEIACSSPVSGMVTYSPSSWPTAFAYTEVLPDGLRLHLDDQCIDCYNSRYIQRGPVPTRNTSWGEIKSLYGD